MLEKEQAFKDACSEFLERRVWRGRKPLWSVDRLVTIVNQVAQTAAAAGENGTSGRWTVTTARLVSIWRSEAAKPLRKDRWNIEQRRKRDEHGA